MTLVPIESLRLHADAERVPLAGATDLAALRASLDVNGQQDPIDVTDDGVILDGRTRWHLLKELGALDIAVRQVSPSDQKAYIVDRAVARRHLTPEQKRALNALLEEMVVEEVADPKTGQLVRIGLGQSQRARKLGVDRRTIQNWDREQADGKTFPSAPTHQRLANDRIEPLHKKKTDRDPRKSAAKFHRGQQPLKRRRYGPRWTRYFAKWCRSEARPEDKTLLLRLDEQLHAALAANEVKCDHSEEENHDISAA